MLKINQYVKAQSLEEAYTLYQKKSSVVLGGMLWLKLQNRAVGTAIDLCDLELDRIEETEEAFRIGAMVSLRALETHPALNEWTGGALERCLSAIIGVQFRNMATIGGSISGKFGFSDPLTLFLALGAELEFYHKGRVSLEEWLTMPRERDILTAVILPKKPARVDYRSMRNTATDFPVLTCALCITAEETRCVLGARPAAAVVFRDEKHLLEQGITEKTAAAFAEDVAERAVFGSNLRGSADYRRKLAKVLVRRGLLALKEEE